jgi:S1-C subfamily serine protease
MFSKASKKIRESTYGFLGSSIIAENGPQKTINVTNGTAFMVASGYLITAAHSVHQESKPDKPVHQTFEIIRTPDIGQKMERAIFVAEDPIHDIALLEIENPKNTSCVKLEKTIISRGKSCGFLGFPLANVIFMPNERQFALFERFQGAQISNYMTYDKDRPNERTFYEVDSMMYSGSSGCPAFTTDAKVVGMQVASVMQKRKEDDQTERVAISLVVPSIEILAFLKSQNIKI